MGAGGGDTVTALRCPVCHGNGIVHNGFYNQTSGYWTTSSTAPERCRSCDGGGYVVVDRQDVPPQLVLRRKRSL